jgi:acetyl esterase/lipase
MAMIGMAVTLAACSPAALLNATVPVDGTTVMHDVAYETGPRHTLDIYRPKNPTGPIVVFLYGGSWRMGDKSMYAFVALPLAARGAVVVVPDYRLYPEVDFPDFVVDNAVAVRWAFAHAAELGADPGSIFIVGHSAGAYNAAMLALDPHFLAQQTMSRDDLAGVVGLAGPYNFLPIVDPDIIPVFASVHDGPASQPISYVDGHNPPMLLAAGEDDTIVKPKNTSSLAARINQSGGPVEVKLYPDVGHIGLITAFAPLFQWRAPVLDDVWRFIESHRRSDSSGRR